MLNWLKKGTYRSLTDVLQAIRREIVSLQPKDTSSIKWTKGAAGMEAHVISVESAESVGSPNLLDDIVGEDDLIKGHFQLYSYTDLETNIEFVAVMNTENDFDNPLEAQPNQCVVRYKGTTNTYSTTYDIKTFRINYTSLSENKNHNVYLMIPFMKQPYIEIFTDSQPVTDANLEYIYIGRVRKGEYNPVITQAYEGGVLYFDSAQYFGAFKVVDSSYTETITNEEGEEEEIEVSQISVINPEDDEYCGFIYADDYYYVENTTLPKENNDIYAVIFYDTNDLQYKTRIHQGNPLNEDSAVYYLLAWCRDNIISQKHHSNNITVEGRWV